MRLTAIQTSFGWLRLILCAYFLEKVKGVHKVNAGL